MIKFMALILIIGFIYTVPTNVLATTVTNGDNVFFLAFDEQGENFWVVEKLDFEASLTREEKTKYIFEKLFKGKIEPNFYNLPSGIVLYDIEFQDNLLIISVSEDILRYNYGSYYEILIKNKIVKNALSIYGVDKVTLLISGNIAYLKKGLVIHEFSKD